MEPKVLPWFSRPSPAQLPAFFSSIFSSNLVLPALPTSPPAHPYIQLIQSQHSWHQVFAHAELPAKHTLPLHTPSPNPTTVSSGRWHVSWGLKMRRSSSKEEPGTECVRRRALKVQRSWGGDVLVDWRNSREAGVAGAEWGAEEEVRSIKRMRERFIEMNWKSDFSIWRG